MTITEPTTEERIVVIPEVSIPTSTIASAEEVLALVEELRPRLDELHTKALAIRDQYDQALMALGQHVRIDDDGILEMAGEAVGWTKVWEAVIHVTGDRFSPDGEFSHIGMDGPQLRRGGVPSFPPGTVANVEDPEGQPVQVEVMWAPSGSGDTYRVVDLADPVHKAYACTHQELTAGLVSTPAEEDRLAIGRRHAGWRQAAMAEQEAQG